LGSCSCRSHPSNQFFIQAKPIVPTSCIYLNARYYLTSTSTTSSSIPPSFPVQQCPYPIPIHHTHLQPLTPNSSPQLPISTISRTTPLHHHTPSTHPHPPPSRNTTAQSARKTRYLDHVIHPLPPREGRMGKSNHTFLYSNLAYLIYML
jgi:hypothetical protein